MDPRLRSAFDAHYRSGISEWRRISAVDKARHVVELCGGERYAAVLEIGAGDGSLLQRLSELGFGRDLAALEVSEAAVDVLKARGIPNLSSVLLYDGYRMPYPDRRFDLAILSHVVEHAEHPRALLREAARVARDVFVEAPLELHVRTPRDFAWTSTGHINLFSPVIIRQLVQSVGLAVVTERVFNPGYPIYRYVRRRFVLPNYLLTQILLRVAPCIALQLLMYHWCPLCRTRQGCPTSPKKVSVPLLSIVVGYELIFLRFPLEPGYLLPALLFGLLALALWSRPGRWVLVVFVLAQLSYAFVNFNVVAVDKPHHATSAKVGLSVEPGYLLTNVRDRWENTGR